MPLDDDEIRQILEVAFQRGIVTLDTAPLYGNIESRLGALCEGLEFQINSKIPPIFADSLSPAAQVIESACLSRRRLGRKLKGLLFHRAEDLRDERSGDAWNRVHEWANSEGVAMGVSGYDPELDRAMCADFELSNVQLPGNALHLRHCAALKKLRQKPTLQLRSAFLQGLLLMPIELAIKRVPIAADALRHWHQWLSDQDLSPLRGALSIMKGFDDIDTCVVELTVRPS